MKTLDYVENFATLFAIVLIVLGGFFMGGGGWSICGLALIVNLNRPKVSP